MPTLTERQTAGTLTNSSRRCFAECQRKYRIRYIDGVVPDREPEALRMGSAYHLGQEILAKTGDIAEAAQAVRSNYAEPPAWVREGGEELQTKWAVECEKVVRLLCGWAWRWQDDPVEIVETESTFSLPIINPDTGKRSRSHRQSGVRDQLVRLADGSLALREFKTTGDSLEPTSNYWSHLRMDPQVSAYFESYRIDGIEVRDVLYDVTRKPGIQPKKLTKAERALAASTQEYHGERFDWPKRTPPERETPAMYGARLNADIAKRPDYYFARKIITRTEADLVEFRQDLWQLHRTISECKRRDRWPRTGVLTRRCVGPFAPCEYLKICESNIDLTDGVPEGYVVTSNVHPELRE